MNNLSAGSMLVDTSAVFPVPLRTASSGDLGWVRVADNAEAACLEPALAAAGWNFFYLAGTVTARGFGMAAQSRLDSALHSLVQTTKKRGCNCLQIDSIAQKRYFGIPCVEVSGHLRQIQKSNLFRPEGPL